MRRIYLAFAIVATLAGCTNTKKPKSNSNIPPKFVENMEPVFIHEANLWFLNKNNDTIQEINIELANTPHKREKGLMNRKYMEENNGMLFIFDIEERQSFWMKNTHIPLDLIFINAELNIVHIAPNCEPYSLSQIPSFEYAQYVVEVVGGYCAKKNINVGDRIKYTIL